MYKEYVDWYYIADKNKYICCNKELIDTVKEKLSWSFLFDDSLSLKQKKSNHEFEFASEQFSRLNLCPQLIFDFSDVFNTKAIFSNEHIKWTFEIFVKLFSFVPSYQRPNSLGNFFKRLSFKRSRKFDRRSV